MKKLALVTLVLLLLGCLACNYFHVCPLALGTAILPLLGASAATVTFFAVAILAFSVCIFLFLLQFALYGVGVALLIGVPYFLIKRYCK